MKLSYWFLVFFLFSVLGYISEVIYCYILDKKLVNRGFLHGPYCPIYGVGALASIILLRKYYGDPLILFLLGMFLFSVIEYISSYLMEKLFNDKWWDYSNYKYNLNGRVCLKNSIFFGIGGLLVIYVFYPLVYKLIYNANLLALNIITIVLFILFVTDLVFTIINTLKLKKQRNIIKKIKNEISDKLPNINDILANNINESLKKYKNYPKHIINAFPNIKKIHEDNINLLKNSFNNRFRK